MARLDDPLRLAAFQPVLLHRSDEPELDDVCRRAAAAADAPIALVTMVAEHVQLFRAAVGLGPALEASRATNRCDSFCQFVVESERPFVVEDARTDPRVPKALVEGFQVIAYAGVPLRVRGTLVGSLCVIDVAPHRFSDDVVAALHALSDEAGRLLEALPALPAQRPTREVLVEELAQVVSSFGRVEPALEAVRALESETASEGPGEQAAVARELARWIDGLRKAALATTGSAWRSDDPELAAALERLERAALEGSSIAYVVRASEAGAVSAGDARKALRALTVALGFFETARDAAKVALEHARALD